MGQRQFPLDGSNTIPTGKASLLFPEGGGPLGTRCSEATYDMGLRTNLPVSLNHGHICYEYVPNFAELRTRLR